MTTETAYLPPQFLSCYLPAFQEKIRELIIAHVRKLATTICEQTTNQELMSTVRVSYELIRYIDDTETGFIYADFHMKTKEVIERLLHETAEEILPFPVDNIY